MSVQFCVGECRPVSCDNGKESFGRRRRSAEAGGDQLTVTPRPLPDFSVATLPSMPGAGQPRASQLVYDDRIGQEIIEGDTDLSKEIYVESGTTVDQVRDPGDLGTRVDAGQILGSKLRAWLFLIAYDLCMWDPISHHGSPPVQHSVLNVKAVVASFNQERAFSVITNLQMDLFELLLPTLPSLTAV